MKKSLRHIAHAQMTPAQCRLPADANPENSDGWAWQFGKLRVIASWGMGWDHVSVSHQDRIPTWEEMCWVKGQFFEPDECVMQLHPPEADYVNNHSRCLHLWRPQDVEIPRPPSMMVGDKRLGVIA